jgi:hypothetical protein
MLFFHNFYQKKKKEGTVTELKSNLSSMYVHLFNLQITVSDTFLSQFLPKKEKGGYCYPFYFMLPEPICVCIFCLCLQIDC